MNTLYQVKETYDGSHTIYIPDINEHYHSVHGAIQESEHIFIKNGFDYCTADPLYIFEVGFGTGLNVLLTALKNIKNSRKVFYTSIEKYPLGEDVIKLLNHRTIKGTEGENIFDLIHKAGWDQTQQVYKNFSLLKVKDDLLSYTASNTYDLIYFDAFGPEKQPEMWSEDIFSKIARMTRRGGVFITYSSKGDIKRLLKANGFKVTLLQGPPGKRHIIRAVKL